ncbi:hypothetical protein RRG08_014448 [Elysia crispata]|uniref:Uncharacterized protein n=1 Tax=Elysia crispata TaxID=231223 RepID=A0AAE0YGV0_9GAST|nr:hypothetical protein RRG08_014448 [Elysia crispata]
MNITQFTDFRQTKSVSWKISVLEARLYKTEAIRVFRRMSNSILKYNAECGMAENTKRKERGAQISEVRGYDLMGRQDVEHPRTQSREAVKLNKVLLLRESQSQAIM